MRSDIRLLALIVILAGLVAAPLGAQTKKQRKGAKKNAPAVALDTVNLAYRLQPGATISYHVVSHDTLYLYGGNSLSQSAERSYIVTYTCDSLTRDGLVMSMRYDGYAAREQRDSLPVVTRTSHPWTDRTIRFLMTSDGRRVRYLSDDKTTGTSPSGPFQPLVLPFLGSDTTYVGDSQVFDLQHWLVDNVSPSVLFAGESFRTVAARRDTLGLGTIELHFSETGRSTFEPPSGPITRASINGASRCWFSPALGLPVAGHAEGLYNLTLTGANGAEATGRQKIEMQYEMVIRDEATTPKPSTREIELGR
jgi:hypothetical protein